MNLSATKQVIEHLVQHGGRGKGWFHQHQDPRPLDAQSINALTLPDARPLPPSLREWLAFDASWFRLAKGTPPELEVRPLRDILTGWSRAMTKHAPAAESFTEEQLVQAWVDLLPDPTMVNALALELLPSGSQEHLLLFHKANRRGEYPVLGCHNRFEFWLKYKSFGDYLSHYFGLSEPD
jgi:hypothetical protein|nr:hypothetical protein MFMH1_06870 [Myxococcus sp. MH1]